jgi:glycerol-1-phosphate dehydrogenase [NAD(P)+]
MTAEEEGRVEGWHGAQVGVCTVVTATLYERLREIGPTAIDIDRLVAGRPSREVEEARLRERHGTRAGEVIAEFSDKRLSDAEYRQELSLLRDDWSSIWKSLDDSLRPATRIRDLLTRAGAPVTVGQLGLTPDHLRNSYLAAREIRGRFTVLDLAADLGVLDSARDEVLRRSGCLS